MAELLYLKEAEQVVTVAGASDKPKVGEDLSEIGVIERGSVIVEGEKIAFAGTDADARHYLQKRSGKVKTIEARGSSSRLDSSTLIHISSLPAAVNKN